MKSKQEMLLLIAALFTINAFAVPAMATVKCDGEVMCCVKSETSFTQCLPPNGDKACSEDRVAVCQAAQEKTRTIAEKAFVGAALIALLPAVVLAVSIPIGSTFIVAQMILPFLNGRY